jgi:hypothetical protein
MPIPPHYLDQAGRHASHQAGSSRSRVRTARLDKSRESTTMLMDLDWTSPRAPLPSHTANVYRSGRRRRPLSRRGDATSCFTTPLSPEECGAWGTTQLQRRCQEEEEAIVDLEPPHADVDHRLQIVPKGSCDTKAARRPQAHRFEESTAGEAAAGLQLGPLRLVPQETTASMRT